MTKSKGTGKGLLVPQEKLGKKGMILMVSLMNMVAPLSTDMYLPALPKMGQYFHTSEAFMNYTLIGFFFFFAIGMLIFGPVSDKYGRKKLLLIGVAIYFAASIACALAFSAWFLVIARIIQAMGGGCMVSVATAVVKDAFSGEEQSKVIALAQILMVFAPMLAPIVGAWILRWFSFRATFVVLAGIAAAAFIIVCMMKETLSEENRYQGNVMKAFSGLGTVLRNRVFTLFLLAAATLQLPMMAYISTSSYIYVDNFGLPETTYSYFFAANAALSVLGPIIAVYLRRKNAFKITPVMMLMSIASGILLLLFGNGSPLSFLLCYIVSTFAAAGIRPYSTTLLLNQQNRDTGSASALINFVNSLSGTLGMMLITALWTNYIRGLGLLLIICAVIGLVLIFALLKVSGKKCLEGKYW